MIWMVLNNKVGGVGSIMTVDEKLASNTKHLQEFVDAMPDNIVFEADLVVN